MNTDWLDERIRLGEIPPHARTQAEKRASSPEGALAQEALEASDADLLRRVPPERLSAKLRERRASSSTAFLGWPRLGLAAFATSAVLVLALSFAQRDEAPAEAAPVLGEGTAPANPDSLPHLVDLPKATRDPERIALSPTPTPDDGVRIRGDRKLSLLVVSPHGPEAIGSEGLVAGSILRVVAPQASHAAIYSLDETGMVQRHWPLSGDSSAALPAGPLARDWETDPTPGWERFVLVSAPAAFALRDLETHLRGLRASGQADRRRISFPGGGSVTDTLLRRVVR